MINKNANNKTDPSVLKVGNACLIPPPQLLKEYMTQNSQKEYFNFVEMHDTRSTHVYSKRTS